MGRGAQRAAVFLGGAAALLCVGVPRAGIPAVRAQQTSHLSERVDAAPDGTVRFAYAARDGVCGDGGSVNLRRGDQREDPGCHEGPVWVELDRRGDRIDGLDLWVGRTRPSRAPSGTNLGTVGAAEAAWYLVSLARRGYGVSDDAAGDAVAAASLADSVEIWPALLETARDRTVATEAREAAIFWLSQFAGEKAAEPLEAIARSDDDADVRQAALFGLAQLPDDRGFEVLMRVARQDDDPELVQASLFWLGQTKDPRAIALFEEILARD